MIESSGSSIKTESLQRAGSSSNPRRLLSLWPLTSTVTLSEENGGVRLMMSYGISSISPGIIKKYSSFLASYMTSLLLKVQMGSSKRAPCIRVRGEAAEAEDGDISG